MVPLWDTNSVRISRLVGASRKPPREPSAGGLISPMSSNELYNMLVSSQCVFLAVVHSSATASCNWCSIKIKLTSGEIPISRYHYNCAPKPPPSPLMMVVNHCAPFSGAGRLSCRKIHLLSLAGRYTFYQEATWSNALLTIDRTKFGNERSLPFATMRSRCNPVLGTPSMYTARKPSGM